DQNRRGGSLLPFCVPWFSLFSGFCLLVSEPLPLRGGNLLCPLRLAFAPSWRMLNAPASRRLPVRESHPKPAAEVVRSSGWIATLLVFVGILTFLYAPLFKYSFGQWLKPDYSHGFLVPIFAVYLAWHWKDWAPKRIRWPEPWGLAFVGAGVVLYTVAAKYNIAKEWLQGFSLVLNLSGAALLLGGWSALRWL